jgi:hypothetical protein
MRTVLLALATTANFGELALEKLGKPVRRSPPRGIAQRDGGRGYRFPACSMVETYCSRGRSRVAGQGPELSSLVYLSVPPRSLRFRTRRALARGLRP